MSGENILRCSTQSFALLNLYPVVLDPEGAHSDFVMPVSIQNENNKDNVCDHNQRIGIKSEAWIFLIFSFC